MLEQRNRERLAAFVNADPWARSIKFLGPLIEHLVASQQDIEGLERSGR
ncbi:hypothetical protein [Streptomyces avermitilis]